MENLFDSWKSLDEKLSRENMPGSESLDPEKIQSGLLLNRLSQKLKLGIYWTLFFMAGLLFVAAYNLKNFQILIMVGVYFLIFLWNLALTGKYYRKIKRNHLFVKDTKTMLENYYQRVLDILLFERIWGQFVIPMGLVAGVIYHHLKKFGSFDLIVIEPITLIGAGILMVTIVPLVILWVGWSQKIAFKEDLEALRKEINSLSKNSR